MKSELVFPDPQNPGEMPRGSGGLPVLPVSEGGEGTPQNTLSSKTSQISDLWGELRDPASVIKMEEQLKVFSINLRTPRACDTCMHTHTHHTREKWKKGKS